MIELYLLDTLLDAVGSGSTATPSVRINTVQQGKAKCVKNGR